MKQEEFAHEELGRAVPCLYICMHAGICASVSACQASAALIRALVSGCVASLACISEEKKKKVCAVWVDLETFFILSGSRGALLLSEAR